MENNQNKIMNKIELDGGKYTLIEKPTGTWEALRYGEPWRDLVGDNLIHFLICKVQELEEKLKER